MNPNHSLGGVDEYLLENGMRVLFIPDFSQPSVTINIVFNVGSRHERRGERGMAHLLEHMLFKATPSHPDIPQALRDRGARFNGTTWLDRTHYYETLRSGSDAVEFALQLEFERMSQVRFEAEVFGTEIGVVKNELLRGENQPSRVLFQRVQSLAFLRHGYGHPTIGLLEDLDAMGPDDLAEFYKRHYQPSNTTLVVAGDFEAGKTLGLIQDRFGSLENRFQDLSSNELMEPPQDGAREVALQRVSNVAELVAAYHVPCGAHVDFPLLQLWALSLSQRPTGALYQRLVESQLATDASCLAFSLHDPGLFLASIDVHDCDQVEPARQALLEVIESRESRKLDSKELSRAQNEMLKRYELEVSDSSRLAVALTEYISLGDWRNFFWQRESYAKADLDSMQRVADSYFCSTNRTLGLLMPQDREEKIEIPVRTDQRLVASKKDSLPTPSAGEPFDPDPLRIQNSIELHTPPQSDLKIACLQRETRNSMTTLLLHLRFGNQEFYSRRQGQSGLLGSWIQRGSAEFSQEQVQDELRRLRAWFSFNGFRGGLEIEGQVPRRNLADFVALIESLIRSPKLEDSEFEILRKAELAEIDQQCTQPTSLASNRLNQELAPFEEADARYIPDFDTRLAWLRDVAPKTVREIHEGQLSGQVGEAILIGPQLDETVVDQLSALSLKWSGKETYQRIPQPFMDCSGQQIEIPLADKSNVALSAGVNLELNDADEDFPRLMVANYIFGGATLVSRLGKEVRQKRGLSYSISSRFDAHMLDTRGRLSIHATTNPENWKELRETVKAELLKLLEEGVTQTELDQAKGSLLDGRYVSRANPRNLANIVATNLFCGRTLSFTHDLETKIKGMTVGEIQDALQRWIQPEKMTTVTCGTLSAS